MQVYRDYIVTTLMNDYILSWDLGHGEASMDNISIDSIEINNLVPISINDRK